MKISKKELKEIVDDIYNSFNSTIVLDLEDAAHEIKDVIEEFRHNKRIQKLLWHSYNYLEEAINSIKRLET